MKGSMVNMDIYGSFMNKRKLRVHTLISFPLYEGDTPFRLWQTDMFQRWPPEGSGGSPN